MTQATFPPSPEGHYVQANGVNFHYLEAGAGEPLLLLHGGTMSAHGNWADHLPLFAQHFRVIAPDMRGHGRTLNPTGQYSYPLLADDMMAFIQALGLSRPFLCGFSDGGIIGSLIAIRSAGMLRALVNHAGYDLFQPANSAGYRMLFGGSEDATRANPEHFQREFPEGVHKWQEEHDSVQGANYWKRLLSEIWPMWTQPMAYTVEDFRTIAIPTLISVGDRDFFNSVEEGVAIYRFLARGELSVVPNLAHDFTPLVAQIALDFLLRHRQHSQTS